MNLLLPQHLKKQQGIEIDLITTLPNRYASFSADAPAHEVNGNVEVNRIALPSHARPGKVVLSIRKSSLLLFPKPARILAAIP